MTRERFDPNTPVLLAESSAAIRSAFTPIFEEYQFDNLMIEEEGYGVLRADNSESYGLIVLGSSLEGMSVSKVVAALRAGGNNTDTPILFMYNSKDKAVLDKVMEAGATAYLQWPIKKSVFHKTLEDLLDRRIVSKHDEEERVARYLKTFSEAAGRVKSLRSEGKITEAEAAFPEILQEFFLCIAELYLAKEDQGHAKLIINEAKGIFPSLENEFQCRTGEKPAESAEKKSTNEEEQSRPSERINPGIPVLVADGGASHLKTFKEAFEEFQLTNVTFIHEGVGVLRVDDTTKFDLIVLGGSFEDMDAFKVVAALRAGENNSETPIIFVQGRGEKISPEKVAQVGIAAVIERSGEPEPLRDAIEKTLRKRITSKSEVNEFSSYCLDVASKTVSVIYVLKKDGLLKGAESAFLDNLLESFLCAMEVYLSKGDRKSAEGLLTQSRNIFPGINELFSERTEAFVIRGLKFLEEEKFAQARAEFEAALTLNEENVETNVALGESFYGLGDKEAAGDAFRCAIASPGSARDPKVLMRLGLVACRYEYFDIALSAYDRLISTYQMDPKLFYNKALIHVRTKEFGKALPLLGRAIALDEKFVPAKALQEKVRGWMSEMPDVDLQLG